METLEFKPVPGFEELYKISFFGEVYSLPRSWKCHNGATRTHHGLFLRQATNSNGYNTCILFKDSIPTPILPHRIVAKLWVPNPNPELFDEVNHLNGIKFDNFYKNLEWADTLGNMRHAFATGLNSPINMTGKFNEDHHLSKPLLQIDKSGNLIAEWPSLKEVYRQLNYYPANISRVCLGLRPFAYGFSWKYKE